MCADDSCVDLLKEHKIRVSERYWQGEGAIHGRKAGHWCSFLRFLVECKSRLVSVCVSIEDDLRLEKQELMRKLDKLLQKDWDTPTMRHGPGMNTIVAYDRSSNSVTEPVRIQQ